MEIRNIYEDYSGEERLYSVLMDEDEVALFSAMGEIVKARRAANKLAKRNWEINRLEKQGLLPTVPKFIQTRNNRTVLNPEYKPALDGQLALMRHKATYADNPVYPHGLKESVAWGRRGSDHRAAIKASLESGHLGTDGGMRTLSYKPGKTEHEGMRGFRKSDLRKRAMEIGPGTGDRYRYFDLR